MRSHILKIVYRYLQEDLDLRNQFALSNTLTDFRKACQILRLRLVARESPEQSEEEEGEESKASGLVSWYNRHRLSVTNNNTEHEGEEGEERSPCTSRKVGPKLPFSALNEDVLEDSFNLFQL